MHRRLQGVIARQPDANWQNFYLRQLWNLSRYAHFMGLDNRWQMFGRQSRFNWHFQIYGLYSDGLTTRAWLLPEPRQMPRNWFERNFIDFKEGKFQLNIYDNRPARMAYAHYLGRRYPLHDGMPIQSVAFELRHQWIREPRQAQLLHSHLDPTVNKRIMDVFWVGPTQ